MTEETRSKLSLINLVEAPMKSYSSPIPKDGLIYDYRIVKVSKIVTYIVCMIYIALYASFLLYCVESY